MYYGLLALLTRALRQDARQLKNHIFRLCFVAFIYLALLGALLTAGAFGAPGLRLFASIAWLNAVFVTCAGIGFFSSAITEEKEEETIGLLMMAGLNPLGILLGKSTSRLIQSSMLLVVQFPFMLLAVTLGGVTPLQIMAAYVSLLAFMVLLANVALVFSTVCDRGGSAAGLTTLLLLAHFLLAAYAPSLNAVLPGFGLSNATWYGRLLFSSLDLLAESSAYLRLVRIMETGFNEEIISTQVISNVVGGVLCFGLAWLVFVPSLARSAVAGNRGLVMRSRGRFRLFSAGRAWPMPLAWKDFQFIAGGYSFAIIKVFGYLVLFAVLAWFMAVPTSSGMTFGNVAEIYSICMIVALVVEACVLSARIFHDEVRLQTMSTLLMLPRTIPYLAYTKTLGCLLGLLPTLACVALGAVLNPDIGPGHVFRFVIDPFTWSLVLVLIIFLHLVALLSLFVKWGALPMAIFMMGPLSFCCPVGQLMIMVIGQNGIHDPMGSLAATITIWILMGLVCFVFQMMIAARLQEVGSS